MCRRNEAILLLIALHVVLFLLMNYANTNSLHIPSSNQLQEEEADDLAGAFVKELTGVELTGL